MLSMVLAKGVINLIHRWLIHAVSPAMAKCIDSIEDSAKVWKDL